MLIGGSDESNTDPMATGPAPGEEWITTPPHVMLMVPGGFDAADFTTDHTSGYPYIMWDDSPVEHLMIPVADMPAGEAMPGMLSDAEIEALKAEVIAIEFATFDHLRTHDVEAARAETAEDFISIDTTGLRTGREEWLALVADEKQTLDEPLRDNLEVLVISPEAVLVMYTLAMHGAYAGEEFSTKIYLSALWQKRDGIWQSTFLQTSPIATDSAAAEQIANAESAAPPAIAKDATIMGWAEDGTPSVLLREGTNGWTCMADWPASPGNDPQCNDRVWQEEFSSAFATGEEPNITEPGIAYMLAGGSDPSNTDPMAMEPAPGEEWITSPPHIMILLPDGYDATKFSTEPSMYVPYIMWDGTPYEHLMVPVAGTSQEEMGDTSEQLANILAAAPATIAKNATVLGNPEQEGEEMVVLQEGSNGWICYDDRAVSPGNDPSCNDEQWNAFNDAFAAGEEPAPTAPGIAYMLQGGSDESNMDPMALGPPPGEDWITTPPHIMLLLPGGFDA
jgi:hypothetical protein